MKRNAKRLVRFILLNYKMFEWEFIEEWNWWEFYKCVDVPYRAVRWKVVFEWKTIGKIKERITELNNRKPYTKDQRRNYKWVYIK